MSTRHKNPTAQRSNGSRSRWLAIALVFGLTLAGLAAVFGLAGTDTGTHNASAVAPGQVQVSATIAPAPTNSGPGPKAKPVAIKADLGQIAPADTTFALLLPTSVPDAWATVTGIGDPRMRLGSFTLPPQVLIVGYFATTGQSHTANTGWPGSDAVVLVTGSSTQAADVNDALLAKPNREFVTTVKDNTVLVTQTWNDPASMFTGARLSTVSGYADALSHRGREGQGTLWVDGHAWLANMASASADAVRIAFSTGLSSTIPAGQSYWIAGAGADAYSYNGSWIGSIGNGASTAPSAPAPSCKPDQSECSSLSTVTENPGQQAAGMIQPSRPGDGSASLTVPLADLQSYFGIGGQPSITALVLTRKVNGDMTLKLNHG